MNTQQFIALVRKSSIDGNVTDIRNALIDPPGRSPSDELLELSKWYRQLDKEEKKMVEKLLKCASQGAVFGLFCLLDGVRAIDPAEEGALELWYVKGHDSTLINDPSQEYLHEILNARK